MTGARRNLQPMASAALDYLRKHGPSKVAAIAKSLGIPRESVYAELVPLESRGVVRVVVSYSDATAKEARTCEWESIQ